MNKNRNTPIKSAETLAALRAIAANEKHREVRCTDYLAKNFISLKYTLMLSIKPHALLKWLVTAISPGSYEFAIIRTRLFDDILLSRISEGIQQLVILGAGYDTRMLRYEKQLQEITVFEIDFPGTQHIKQQKLKKLCKNIPGNLHFIPVDFNEESFETALIKKGFCQHKKSVFLWEGVSYYLTPRTVKSVLTFVSSCASGSSILFDYATSRFVNGYHDTYGGKQVARWLKKINEPFLFGMNEDESSDFVNSCGLSAVSDLGDDELENLYLVTNEGIKIGKTLGHVRMMHAKVIRTE